MTPAKTTPKDYKYGEWLSIPGWDDIIHLKPKPVITEEEMAEHRRRRKRKEGAHPSGHGSGNARNSRRDARTATRRKAESWRISWTASRPTATIKTAERSLLLKKEKALWVRTI
ncbi:hypothetical protein ES703_99126 [subsurface metagenome]